MLSRKLDYFNGFETKKQKKKSQDLKRMIPLQHSIHTSESVPRYVHANSLCVHELMQLRGTQLANRFTCAFLGI